MITDEQEQRRKHSWRVLFEMILREFRLSENDLSKLTGIQQSTINRITRGETKQPYPSTVKRLEEKLNIKIDDSNDVRFTFAKQNIPFKKAMEERHQSDGETTFIEKGKPLDSNYSTYPFISNKEEMKRIADILISNDHLDFAKESKTIKEKIELPIKDMNGVVSVAFTDYNEPLICKGDIIALSFDDPVNDGDVVAICEKNGDHYTGVYSIVDRETITITFTNKKYDRRRLRLDDIAVIFKVVYSGRIY